ncbi:MAG: glycosyltransferase [Firmicutes bacterium]|nr:glycosyltransferase [Alicyclobacillaceae bacterium]MCL6497246.1 glycosyltransferase [Bacillota bacterium]
MHVTIVIPARDEAPHIAVAIEAVDRALTPLSVSYDVVVVDDHSEDDTASAALTAAVRCPLSVTANPGAPGKGAALRQGFARSRGDLVGFLDADLEFPAAILTAMVDAACRSGHPHRWVGIGRRAGDRRRWHERWSSRLAHWLIERGLGLGLNDTQAGVKLFPGWFARDILTLGQEDGWLFDLEALWWARQCTLEIAEFPVVQRQVRPRRAGLGEMARCLGDFWALSRRLSHTAWFPNDDRPPAWLADRP